MQNAKKKQPERIHKVMFQPMPLSLNVKIAERKNYLEKNLNYSKATHFLLSK
jgi:hypothetical protein